MIIGIIGLAAALAACAAAIVMSSRLRTANAIISDLTDVLSEAGIEHIKAEKELRKCMEELRASKEREAETAEKVAKVMYSTDVESGYFSVKVAYCARYVEDWPGLFLEMVDYAEQEIIRNWREEKKRRDNELRRTCEEYRDPSQSTWGGASE